jgi:hypothetical protein
MHEVDLGPGPMVTGILQALPGRIQVPTSIRVADDSEIAFRMEDRRMWHEGLEFGVPLPRAGTRLDLTSQGSVGLDDKVLDLKLALPFPADLPSDRPVLASLAGKTVSIGIGGKLGEPRIDFDGSIRGVAADVIAATIDRLRNRPAAAAPTTSAPQATTAQRQPSPPPRPGWAPGQGDGADVAADGEAADGSSADGEPEALPAPPPRPGWSPIKRPGLGAQAGEAFAKGAESARLSERDRGPQAGQPPAEFAGGNDAQPLDGSATAADGEQPAKQGTAQIIDQLKDRLAPQMADSPQTERVIDLVGGLIDEVARRRAQRAAAEAANGPQPGQAVPPAGAQQAPGAAAGPASPTGPGLGAGPRRGRILRRFLQPEQPGQPAAPPSGP